MPIPVKLELIPLRAILFMVPSKPFEEESVIVLREVLSPLGAPSLNL